MKKGSKMSIESREKMRVSHLGKKCSLETRLKMSKARIGKKLPLKTILKMRERQSGSGNNNWKGDDVGYWGIHRWLIKTFGKAKICENGDCPKINKNFQWALRKGELYQRNRLNFIRLCKSCHSIYDGMIKNIK